MKEIIGTIDMPSFTDVDNNDLYSGSESFVVTAKETDCCPLELDFEIEP